MKTSNKYAKIAIFPILTFSLSLASCSESKFTGSKGDASKNGKNGAGSGGNGSGNGSKDGWPSWVDVTDQNIQKVGDKYIVDTAKLPNAFELADQISAESEVSLWTVNSAGAGNKIQMKQGYPLKSFTGTGAGGHRTFVSEFGLFIGTTGGKIYYTPNDFAEGSTSTLVATLPANAGSRVCVTSFLIDSKPYLGAAWVAADGNTRMFSKVALNKQGNPIIDAATIEHKNLGAGAWGYSCFIDQKSGVFWSAFVAGKIYGVNVKTGEAVDVASAPNASVVYPNQFNLTAPAQQSYAIGGGGNMLLSGNGIYTAAYDPTHHVVYWSARTPNLYVASGDCYNGKKQCTKDDVFMFNTTMAGFFGPLSALNDGRIIALERHAANSGVYLISLKDSKDLSKGINVEKIKEVPGDVYMYTDFTGATLYAQTKEITYTLEKAEKYVKEKKVSASYINWESLNVGEKWTGLKLYIRCYSSSVTTKPEFVEVTKVLDAGNDTGLKDIKGCSGAAFDKVDVKLEGDKDSSQYAKVKKITFKAVY